MLGPEVEQSLCLVMLVDQSDKLKWLEMETDLMGTVNFQDLVMWAVVQCVIHV